MIDSLKAILMKRRSSLDDSNLAKHYIPIAVGAIPDLQIFFLSNDLFCLLSQLLISSFFRVHNTFQNF